MGSTFVLVLASLVEAHQRCARRRPFLVAIESHGESKTAPHITVCINLFKEEMLCDDADVSAVKGLSARGRPPSPRSVDVVLT